MHRKKILFICGSLNQTTMMHKISSHLSDCECYFTPHYCSGAYRVLQRLGLLDWTIIGGQNRQNTEKYLDENSLPVDYAGAANDYDLIVTCTDMLVQKNIRKKKVILVQEGMTDPKNLMFHVVRLLRWLGVPVPLWFASTSTTGLSDSYMKFCVASEGYRAHFIANGIKAEKIEVTGIPNFDNAEEFLANDFPHRDYVLVATTDTRENFKWDNRKKFLRNVEQVAGDRDVIFRLHPNEDAQRSTREIREVLPRAMVFTSGNTSHMVANCHTLITQFSSVVYLGISLGKRVYSYFDLNSLKKMVPVQNGGQSAKNIAELCRRYL